jgi:hypothetical protein
LFGILLTRLTEWQYSSCLETLSDTSFLISPSPVSTITIFRKLPPRPSPVFVSRSSLENASSHLWKW